MIKPLNQLIALNLLGLLVSSPVLAYDYQGHILQGGYVAREQLPAEITGSSDNDIAILSTRLFLDVKSIGQNHYQLLTDIRDNHDFFDKLDAQRLDLTSRNSFRLRQLVLRDPGDNHRYYWSVGRFLPADNNIIYNDGAEAGIRITRNNRLGIFAGYRPRVNDERSVELTPTAYQAGVYQTYENEGATWDDGKYISNMLILAPKYLDDSQTRSSAYINQSLMHFGPDFRLSTYLNLQGQPKIRAEDAAFSADKRFTAKFSTSFSASRIDLTEYRNQRDIFETLSPTPYTQGKITSRYRLNETLRLDGNLVAGQRQNDRLRKYEASAGANFTHLVAGHATASILAGTRRNFISRDNFFAASISRYSDKWEVNADLRYSLVKRDSGDLLNQWITSANIGRSFSRAILGTIGAEYARDEKVIILSGLFTLGYRFGSREFTPLRDVAPPNTRF